MAEYLKVEIKVRKPDDRLNWEQRPVIATLVVWRDDKDGGLLYVPIQFEYVQLSVACELVVRATQPDTVEYRWNFAGSDQGHYFQL